MSKIKLNLPKGDSIEVSAGVIPRDLLDELNIPDENALAASINGRKIDLTAPLE